MQMTPSYINQDKTEILVIGEKAEREKLSDHLKLSAINTKEQVKNLGFIIDLDLSFQYYIRNVTRCHSIT